MAAMIASKLLLVVIFMIGGVRHGRRRAPWRSPNTPSTVWTLSATSTGPAHSTGSRALHPRRRPAHRTNSSRPRYEVGQATRERNWPRLFPAPKYCETSPTRPGTCMPCPRARPQPPSPQGTLPRTLPGWSTKSYVSRLRSCTDYSNSGKPSPQPPSRAEYVTATTTLHASLTAIERESLLPGDQVDPSGRIDMYQGMADLRYAATDLVEMTYTAAQLPEPLIRSGLLFDPARILPSTMERIHDRNHGRYVPILLEEGVALIDAAQKGSSSARQVRATLEVSSRHAAAREPSIHSLASAFSSREVERSTDVDGPGLT
jgi:hypothetical protein